MEALLGHPWYPQAQLQIEAPTVTGAPALSEAGADGVWTPGETAEVTLTFSEAVTVDTTGGTPSVGLSLGGTQERSAAYRRGSGTTGLVFGYTLTDADGSHSSLLVPIDGLALNGGAIRSQASGADAALGHSGAAKVALPPQDEGDPFTARFDGLPERHDGGGRAARRDRGGGDRGAAPRRGQRPRLGGHDNPEPVGRHRHPVACAGVHRDERGLCGPAGAWRGGLGDGAGGCR